MINNHGGFTVFGWFNRCVVNDKFLMSARNINRISENPVHNNNDEEMQVETGDIRYHVVHITPTNYDSLDATNLLCS